MEGTQVVSLPRPAEPQRPLLLALCVIGAINVGGFLAVAALNPALINEMADTIDRAVKKPRWENLWIYGRVFGVVLLVELAALGWKRSSIACYVHLSKSSRTDLVLLMLRLLGAFAAIEVLSTGGVGLLATSLSRDIARMAPPLELSGVVQAVAFFVLLDFIDYWAHRWSHEIDVLWQAHKFHHSATDFTIATGSRVHSLDHLVRDLGVAVIGVVIGVPVLASIVVVRLVRQIVDMLQHSRLDWTYGWIGRWVAFSPVGHRIHHSAELEHWDKNYGNIFPIWDHLFGTWYAGDRVNETVDVTNNWYNQRGTVADYLLTYREAFASLARSIRTRRFRTTAATPIGGCR